MDPYTSADWQNFVRWIRSEPQDDAPRLIACDWLEDNGDEVRAEFIRRHIESHRLVGTEKGIKSAKRAKWLLSRNRKKWWTFKPTATWERGFVGQCYVGDRGWTYYHKELLATHPLAEITFDTFPILYLILENNRRLIPTFEQQNLAFRWPCDDLVVELFAREHPDIKIIGPLVENFFADRRRPIRVGERFIYSRTGHITNLRVEKSPDEEGIFILPTLPPPVPRR